MTVCIVGHDSGSRRVNREKCECRLAARGLLTRASSPSPMTARLPLRTSPPDHGSTPDCSRAPRACGTALSTFTVARGFTRDLQRRNLRHMPVLHAPEWHSSSQSHTSPPLTSYTARKIAGLLVRPFIAAERAAGTLLSLPWTFHSTANAQRLSPNKCTRTYTHISKRPAAVHTGAAAPCPKKPPCMPRHIRGCTCSAASPRCALPAALHAPGHQAVRPPLTGGTQALWHGTPPSHPQTPAWQSMRRARLLAAARQH